MARSEVDTARPFRSVKEAVALFGERILASNSYSQKTPIYSVSNPKPIYAISASKPPYSSSSSPRSYFSSGREDEIVVLNSFKKFEAELEETKREVMLLKERESAREITLASLNAELNKNMTKFAEIEEKPEVITSERWEEETTGFEYHPSLAEALSIGDIEDNFGGRRKKMKMKKKPIIPLVGDLFFFKKKVSSDFDNSFFARPFYSR